MFQSKDRQFNAVKAFHLKMDGETQEFPSPYDIQSASFRSAFKIEEIVEFLRAASADQAAFEEAITYLHQSLDAAVEKVEKKTPAQMSLVGQVDALVDLLYLTYGSFVLMGVDPAPMFEAVHFANMGKLFPDGRPRFDSVTGKILKPQHWEERYAPERKIQQELEKQLKRRQDDHID